MSKYDLGTHELDVELMTYGTHKLDDELITQGYDP